MKKETLQHHKDVALVCEEGIFKVEVINNLLIPQNNKIISTQKTHTIPQEKEFIVQIVTGQTIMLKHVESKERLTLFMQFMRLLFNKLKYKSL